MTRLSFVVILISIALVYVLAEEELYSDKYDDVNIANILQNNKLREQYYKCFMDTGPCITGDAKFFKQFFSEAFQTKCKRCTEKQKHHLDTLVDWYTTNNPVQWEAIVKKTIEDLKKKNAGQ
ncbi:ejaculatory bulb-specific protein 3 [Linepithema humile]|uniref:ejaculatory bulb-specific protein 3 n=1 Tax=Linepithema humile TaxID=83485 RepID=UPI0006233328|nr:PREDICTED: ejaculatory bulb-specific protein 3-like [Linepithema humile]